MKRGQFTKKYTPRYENLVLIEKDDRKCRTCGNLVYSGVAILKRGWVVNEMYCKDCAKVVKREPKPPSPK